MRVLFMGSGDFSCPSLTALLESNEHKVVGVVTQPDKPFGRNRVMRPCPVKAMMADDLSGVVMTPANVNDPVFVQEVIALAPDIVVVAAYGQILKKALLDIPEYGFINVHSSLLPAYRGAAPIHWAVINGDETTGVTIMHLNEQMDAGDIILRKEMVIDPLDTAGSLHDRLADLGANILMEALDLLKSGVAERIPQDSSQVTYARKLTKEDGRIDWTQAAEKIYDRVRGMNPWPVCWCELVKSSTEGSVKKDRLRVFSVGVEEQSGVTGEVIDSSGEGPLIAAGTGSVRLLQVQPQGGKIMAGAAYARGHGIKKGDSML